MKVTPLLQTNGAQGAVSVDDGRSASADKIARAKAVASGQQPSAQAQPAPQIQNSIHKIKMKTQVTPAPAHAPQVETEAPANEVAAAAEDNTSDKDVTAQAASEDTKPLSPEAAALIKHKRALDVREKALEARETELKNSGVPQKELQDFKARLKAEPLTVLMDEIGPQVYDQLTQAVLKDMEGNTPTVTRLENEVKSLKKALEDQNQGLTDKEKAAQDQALASMQRDADKLVAADDAFELVRTHGASKQATALIKRIFDETGEIMDVREALEEIENDLLEQDLKVAQTKKVQSKLQSPQIQEPLANTGSQRPAMRTLTNRDTVTSVPTAKERAIAAFWGKKPA